MLRTFFALICLIMLSLGDPVMNHKDPVPQYLYKIVSPEEWQESLMKNEVVRGELDQQFIHMATDAQLKHVAEKFWKGKKIVVLKIDPKKLPGRLVYEFNPGGSNRYYHLYEENIPLDAILETSTSINP